MTWQPQQRQNTMEAIGPLPTSSDHTISPFIFDACFLSGHNQCFCPVPFTGQQLSGTSDIAYSQLSQKSSWSVDLDHAFVHQTTTLSPSHIHVIPSTSPSREFSRVQPQHHGHSDSDSRLKSISTIDSLERRKAQNRQSQRKFRERKENLIKKSSARIIALERDLNEAKLANDALRVAVTSLMRKVGDLPQDFPSIKQPPNGTGFDWEIDGEYLTR
jgi:hypothetical protein